MLSLVRDVTAREAAHGRDLSRVEDCFEALIAHSGAVHLLVDHVGRVTYASRAVRTLLGKDPSDIVGRALGALTAGDGAEMVTALLENARSSPGLVFRFAAQICHGDGTARDVLVTLEDRVDDAAVGAIVSTLRAVTSPMDDRMSSDSRISPDKPVSSDRPTSSQGRAWSDRAAPNRHMTATGTRVRTI